MIGKRGFTLIEMAVTVSVLVICAGAVFPLVGRVNEQTAARDLIPSMVRLVGTAREMSINQAIPMIVSVDTSSNSFQITTNDYQNSNAPQPADGVTAPPSGTPATGGSAPVQTPAVQFPPQALVVQSIPSGVTPETFQLAGKDSSAGEFKLHFYPDGTCDGGGFTFRVGNSEQSVTVDKLGHVRVTDGPLPDPSTTVWEAGQLASRSS